MSELTKGKITEKQRLQFNRMLQALTVIAKQYQTPTQIRRDCGKRYGLSFEETIEMSYENIQELAKNAKKNVKPLHP